ncbi:uncharacterized protein LOC119601566 [Lucilia sericata]|uniref:uncharacterized protein LOC119601566 n=1 Tax=Lucilia sericata TaxID=13632 RepID=UPI0018A85137|nr:uncharacterized protein LOC119601566 [Lucilia sericata]
MRAFIVLCCLATAYAASLGYDYERQSGGVSSGGFGGAPSGGFGGAPSGGFGGAPSGGFGGDQGFQSGPAGGSDYSAPAPAEFEKEFFTYSAPEGAFDDNSGNQQLGNVKRGLRVIFIKGPENSGLENAALQLAKSAGEQRTAIYVLNKQADIGDLANKLNNLNKNNANKPEVHFVKYRTPADAENAQRAIQGQYEGLGGKSSSHNGGVAPVLDFASKAPVSSHGGYQSEPANAYLPANKRVEFKGKLFIFVIFLIQICSEVQAATKTIDLNTRSSNKNKYLPPLTTNNNNNVNKSLQQTKIYTTKSQRSIDNFNTRPELKTTKFPINPSYPPLITSYDPPPSGLVSHSNIQLPFSHSVKLPLLLPKTEKPNDFTKHPGFSLPNMASEEIDLEGSAPMLMIEEPAAVILQPQYNKTIEAAKVLASAFLEASGDASTDTASTESKNQSNSTDVFIVKTQKKAYIIPTHLKKATKPSGVDDLYPLRDQFEKAYTINQFIFVIKPEKINFLNKLV